VGTGAEMDGVPVEAVQLGEAQSGLGREQEQSVVAAAKPRRAIGRGEDGLDLGTRQEVHLSLVVTLARDCEHTLDVLELHNDFAGKVFSASAVSRGKPHPDIFLHAAERMQCEPADCIVIEDSASGVTAGVAAGMIVIGLMAASHMRPEHRQRLVLAGAHFIAATFEEATDITRRLVRSPGARPAGSPATG
jgi:beta-phosphoglucomutase-like phosphatase (HAD superfamily)